MGKLVDSVLFWGGFGLGAAGAFRHFGRIAQSTFRALGSAENSSVNSLAANIAKPLAAHMVAGPTAADAIRAAKEAQDSNMAASIAFLSKPVRFSNESVVIRDQLIALLNELNEADVAASLSINPSQLGLHLDQQLAQDNLAAIVAVAKEHDRDIVLNMEDSATTQATIALFEQMLADGASNLMITLQSNLYRSADDLARLLEVGVRVRLCRGGYAESADYALQSTSEIEANFLRLAERLLTATHSGKHAIATHNGKTLQTIIDVARANDVAEDAFELHMHYGVQPKMQAHMLSLGFQVRQYIPYGSEWQSWVLGRLAERDDGVMMLIEHAQAN